VVAFAAGAPVGALAVDDATALRQQIASLQAQLNAERERNRRDMEQLRAECMRHMPALVIPQDESAVAPSAPAAPAVELGAAPQAAPQASASGSDRASSACACSAPNCPARAGILARPTKRWKVHFTMCHGCLLLVPVLLLGGLWVWQQSQPHIASFVKLRDGVERYRTQLQKLPNLCAISTAAGNTPPVQRVQAKLRDMRDVAARSASFGTAAALNAANIVCPVTEQLARVGVVLPAGGFLPAPVSAASAAMLQPPPPPSPSS